MEGRSFNRYRWLRERELNEETDGGTGRVFCVGPKPSNEVLLVPAQQAEVEVRVRKVR